MWQCSLLSLSPPQAGWMEGAREKQMWVVSVREEGSEVKLKNQLERKATESCRCAVGLGKRCSKSSQHLQATLHEVTFTVLSRFRCTGLTVAMTCRITDKSVGNCVHPCRGTKHVKGGPHRAMTLLCPARAQMVHYLTQCVARMPWSGSDTTWVPALCSLCTLTGTAAGGEWGHHGRKGSG